MSAQSDVILEKLRNEGDPKVRELLASMSNEEIMYTAQIVSQMEQHSPPEMRKMFPLISEFQAALKGTEKSVASGVSIDGGQVSKPPVDLSILIAIADYHSDRFGKTEEAWVKLCEVVETEVRSRIPSETPSSGSGCAGVFLALILTLATVCFSLI